MKTCNRCKETKELNEFGKDKTKKDGARTICKDCDRKREQNLKTSHLAKLEKAVTSCTITTNRILFQEGKRICCQCNNIFSIYSSQRYSCKKCYNENAKKYSKKNKEKIAEQEKEYREKNREKINEYHKKYYEKNKEKIREHQGQYQKENKEKLNEYQRRYYEQNKEKLKKYTEEYGEQNKEKIRENSKKASKKYYERNKEKISEHKKEYNRQRRLKQKEVN